MVTTGLVELEGHVRDPRAGQGERGALLRHSAPQHQPTDPCTTLAIDCARIRRSVGRPRWAWRFTCSTACWSWDARPTSAWRDLGRGWAQCGRAPDPCTTLSRACLQTRIGWRKDGV